MMLDKVNMPNANYFHILLSLSVHSISDNILTVYYHVMSFDFGKIIFFLFFQV